MEQNQRGNHYFKLCCICSSLAVIPPIKTKPDWGITSTAISLQLKKAIKIKYFKKNYKSKQQTNINFKGWILMEKQNHCQLQKESR